MVNYLQHSDENSSTVRESDKAESTSKEVVFQNHYESRNTQIEEIPESKKHPKMRLSRPPADASPPGIWILKLLYETDVRQLLLWSFYAVHSR